MDLDDVFRHLREFVTMEDHRTHGPDNLDRPNL